MVGGPGPGSSVGTVTTGNVRGLGRQMEASEGTLHDLIEMDRPVLDDTVGGALVDADGEVLGICLPGKPAALGHAVPIDLVSKVGDALRKGGRVRWGRLGVKAVDLDPGRAQDLGIPGAAQLVSVEPNSPAAKAGLVKGDLVTQLGITRSDPSPTSWPRSASTARATSWSSSTGTARRRIPSTRRCRPTDARLAAAEPILAQVGMR